MRRCSIAFAAILCLVASVMMMVVWTRGAVGSLGSSAKNGYQYKIFSKEMTQAFKGLLDA